MCHWCLLLHSIWDKRTPALVLFPKKNKKHFSTGYSIWLIQFSVLSGILLLNCRRNSQFFIAENNYTILIFKKLFWPLCVFKTSYVISRKNTLQIYIIYAFCHWFLIGFWECLSLKEQIQIPIDSSDQKKKLINEWKFNLAKPFTWMKRKLDE